MSLLEITALRKYYPTQSQTVKAVDDISFNVEKGDFCLIMGASGSGKSTLLTILGGLNCPSSGKVVIDGIEIYNLLGDRLADFRREYLGFMFQSFQLIPYLTVLENVMLPFVTNEYSIEQQRAKALEVLGKVYLLNKSEMLPGALSGGEQQRAAIARALVNDPEIILADEPTGSLDSVTGTGIMELLKELNGEGKTIITVSHNKDFEYYANRTIYLNDGKVNKINSKS